MPATVTNERKKKTKKPSESSKQRILSSQERPARVQVFCFPVDASHLGALLAVARSLCGSSDDE